MPRGKYALSIEDQEFSYSTRGHHTDEAFLAELAHEWSLTCDPAAIHRVYIRFIPCHGEPSDECLWEYDHGWKGYWREQRNPGRGATPHTYVHSEDTDMVPRQAVQ